MKKCSIVISLILIFALMLSCFSCAESDPVTDESKAVSETETESVADESIEESSEVTPLTQDLGGREIKFLVAGSSYSYYESFEIYAEELNDEAINDAVYERNQIVQQKLGCTIAEEKSSNVAADMDQYVNGGIADYDVYMPMINDAVNHVGGGIMLDLHDFDDYMHLEENWWDQKANDGLEINGKLFFTTGDISILDNECTMVVFFNKTLVDEYNIPNPYELVDNKEWTIDKIYEIGKDFTENLGDSKWNNEDHYGLHVAFNAPHSFFFGCGGTITEKTSDGSLAINMNSEKNIGILDKVFEISYMPDVVTNKTPGCGSFEDICRMFLNDQIIFTTFALTDLKNFRSVDGFDYGILPYPLFDSNQEEYRCLISTGLVPGVCIPSNIEKPEEVAIVLDNMAYYSQDTVTRAYYEVTLKSRDLKDDASERMLDIIFNSRVYDMGYIFNFGGLGMLIETMNNKNSSDFVSNFQAIADSAERALEEALEDFE